mmetsp:Transcript_91058/g.271826  ORF Transcript_91058/g.271826 Transcript_91058/m.271826 type:complete len:237 (-) Transcript_91058:1222-1932(-)
MQLVPGDPVEEVPGDAGSEEAGPLDLLPTAEADAQALVRLLAEHGLHQRLASLVAVLHGEAQVVLQYRVDDVLLCVVVVAKRQSAADKLEEDHAERPDVHLATVALARHDLRRHVVQRARHCEGAVSHRVKLLGQAKVYELEVPPLVQEDVLRLQVAVDYPPLVQRLQEEDQRANVELRILSVEKSHPGHVVVEGAPRDQLRQDVEALRGLKSSDQAQDEGVVQLGQDRGLLADVG